MRSVAWSSAATVPVTAATPGGYQQRLRIARSRERLEFTRDTIEQIAAAGGYEDPGGFRRVFKRVIGMSPAEYRRKFHHAAADLSGTRSGWNVNDQVFGGRTLRPWGS